MEVGAAFVADAKSPEVDESGEGLFHGPPVSAKMGAALYPASCDAWLDATGAALPAAASVIKAFPGVQFIPALAGPAHGLRFAGAHCRPLFDFSRRTDNRMQTSEMLIEAGATQIMLNRLV
ncbi:MAG: hypothetical protein EOO40_01275, partial [Deltaproteobacteria bacterium]